MNNSKNFVVVTDPTCDLSTEIRTRYGIVLVESSVLVKEGEKETKIKADCTWGMTDRKTFYEKLGKNPERFTYAAPNVAEMYPVFKKWVSEGYGVLFISISSAMSLTFSNALKTKNEILKSFPDAEIEVVDSKRHSAGCGMMAIDACEQRDRGKTLEDVAAYLKSSFLTYRQMSCTDDLLFVAKKGRINNSKAFFGTIAGVRALCDFGDNGMVTVLGNAVGKRKGLRMTLEYLKRTAVDIENQVLIIAFTDKDKDAEILRDMIQEELRPREILMTTVFPNGCGISMGPGYLAVNYRGVAASENLNKEKELFKELKS